MTKVFQQEEIVVAKTTTYICPTDLWHILLSRANCNNGSAKPHNKPNVSAIARSQTIHCWTQCFICGSKFAQSIQSSCKIWSHCRLLLLQEFIEQVSYHTSHSWTMTPRKENAAPVETIVFELNAEILESWYKSVLKLFQHHGLWQTHAASSIVNLLSEQLKHHQSLV